MRYTRAAREDLKRLYACLRDKDEASAKHALDAIEKSVDLLKSFPFTCRKSDPATPLLRELVMSFGDAGYVALYEIKDSQTVTILAVRHQREDDFH